MKSPDLKPYLMRLELGYVNKLLGVEFTAPEVRGLLERMRYGVSGRGGSLVVEVPAYRTDVLHPIDLVEDVAVAYGYMNFEPEDTTFHAVGRADATEKHASLVEDLLTGAGFTEVMTLIMSNTRDLFDRMNVQREPVVETENPVSEEHSVCRNWLLPSLMGVLEKNKGMEYPQRIFEVGDCVSAEGGTVRKAAGVIAHAKTSFSEVKAVVLGLLDSLGVSYDVSSFVHGSFIPGRCAGCGVGLFGELHPKVIVDFGLEVPVTAFELDVDAVRGK